MTAHHKGGVRARIVLLLQIMYNENGGEGEGEPLAYLEQEELSWHPVRTYSSLPSTSLLAVA